MKTCTNCGSFALNDAPESGLCDPCYWAEQACQAMNKNNAVSDMLDSAAMIMVAQLTEENIHLVSLLNDRASLPNICHRCIERGEGSHPLGWDGKTLRCMQCGEDALREEG